MSTISVKNLNDFIEKTSNLINSQEKFAIRLLVPRVKEAALNYVNDQTLLGISSFLEKKAINSKEEFISRAELQQIYQTLYTKNNKFAELFSEELGLTKKSSNSFSFNRHPLEGNDLIENHLKKVVDPILAHGLNQIFEKNKPFIPYTAEAAHSAQVVCKAELDSFNLPVKKVAVIAGEENLLLCQATYETPKGEAQVIIPMSISNGKALFPTTFINSQGLEILTEENLKEHIFTYAGRNLRIDAKKVINLFKSAEQGLVEPLSEVEKIMLQVSAERETPASYDNNGIIYQRADAIDKPFPEIRYESPKEFTSLSKKLATPRAAAEMVFGKLIVEQAKNYLQDTLQKFGYRNSQIVIQDCSEHDITYGVSLNHATAFRVPIPVKNKKIQEPSVIFAGNQMLAFSKEGIEESLSQNLSDLATPAITSSKFGLSTKDLLFNLKEVLAQENYSQAEEILTVLQASDQASYETAYQVYLAGLKSGGIKKEDSSKGCRHQYQSSTSIYTLCSQTNLPLHKVCQDKFGNCQPLYRKGMEEGFENVLFSSHKVHVG